MLSVHGTSSRPTTKRRDRFTTTSMGLGLVRLQMDVGLTEEARKTLASLQVFVQRQARRQTRHRPQPSHQHKAPWAALKRDAFDPDCRLEAELLGRGLPEVENCGR
jgi:hypothetical protein